MRIMLAGGGTGGHLYPALSLARALCGAPADPGLCVSPSGGEHGSSSSRSGAQRPPSAGSPETAVLLVTGGGDFDRTLLQADGVPLAAVRCAPLARSSPKAALRALTSNAIGLAQALRLVAQFAPNIVIGTGGYASFPVVAAAGLLNVARSRKAEASRRSKIVLLEPNVHPGLATRALAPMADEVWGAYEDMHAWFPRKFVKTGTPVRASFYRLPDAAQARRALGLDPSLTTVLVFGGSQGARSINAAASSMVARRRLPPDWQVLHLTGRRDQRWMAAERQAESNGNAYVLLPYLDDMALAYAAADIAVARAGASTIAELAVAGLPAVLIPYPYAAEDHQRRNALVFERRGAAVLLEDAKADGDTLYWTLRDAMHGEKLSAMGAAAKSLAQPRALHLMVERILSDA